MNRPSVSIVTFGCRVNQYESEAIRRVLAEGYPISEGVGDVVLLNACTVTGLADRKARQAAHRIHRERPDALIILIGCLADAVAAGLARFDEADLIAGNAWKGRIDQLLAYALSGRRGILPPVGFESLDRERAAGPAGRIRAFLKVQDGCSRACTYCRPRMVRGPSRSKSVKAAIEEAAGLLSSGYPEIVLTGINLAEYRPPDGSLPALVRSLLDLSELRRLRLASINQDGITPELVGSFADKRACPHFHIPLQSGDDRILRRMRRGYTISVYLDKIRMIRDLLPEASFGTDIIVGFPSEDEEAFQGTCRTVEEIGFSNLHAFRYSPRAGTEAAGFDNQIEGAVKRRRAEELNRVWRGTIRPLLDSRIGSTQDVLVEGNRDGEWYGYTRDYMHVSFASDRSVRIGEERSVRITGIDGVILKGEDDDRRGSSGDHASR
ncbi:tRNA (N(6)-L-threonylcarbamoyladenosine(37)-C(2))-methylthiotransferase MtaB [Candidatus Acetothermia bacterium]|nr:MAG: tRNA (N(6)-L-threonylcarbamoyladenosine(37)-C(2))-methylthiotransferase MtaB [Candidatus Acetothermia bacterium]